MLGRTRLGARIDVLGLNPRAAQRFGVRQRPLAAGVLIVSGAFAGLAGAALLTGGASGDRLSFGYSGNFGWDGLLVALLARNRVLVAIPMAFVFAALRTGSSFLAATGVDRKMTDVVQALLVLALLLPPAIEYARGVAPAGDCQLARPARMERSPDVGLLEALGDIFSAEALYISAFQLSVRLRCSPPPASGSPSGPAP